MSNLKNLFETIKKCFSVQKVINFEEYGIAITLEPLTSLEELKVMEVCKEFEGSLYLETLKKSSLAYAIRNINDIKFDALDVEYEDEKGNKVLESKYLFLLKQIETWPGALRDVLFDALNNMQIELEYKVSDKAKYERFTIQNKVISDAIKVENSVPDGFKKIDEPTTEEIE